MPFFVDAVFISFLCLCPALSGPTELYISTDPGGFGPTVSASLSRSASAERRGAHFKRYKVLKRNGKKEEKKIKKTGKGYLSGLPGPAAHEQKSLLPVSVTAFDPSSDRPNSRGPPSILYELENPDGEGGFPCCTSIQSLSSLQLCSPSQYI